MSKLSRIVGIDLGTSTSEIAIMEDGRAQIIVDGEGNEITPSVVGINELGEIIVGSKASEQLILRPRYTVMEVKRLMGSTKEIRLGDKEYLPEEISSFILKHLKEIAENYLEEKVERAVITVPAYFTNEQRRATVRAGELAGLKVERIINEPTAAALSYGIENMGNNEHVLVYDLGGGTLDVTVLEMFDGILEVKASSGNNKLGGKDFDERLMEYVTQNFHEINKVDLQKDLRARARIKKAVEECKIALSNSEEYNIILPFIAEVDGAPVSLEEVITREKFEELIIDLIEFSKGPIEIALKDSALTAEEIDVVLLVGGSTRIPLVKQFLKETLKQEPKSLVDPDLAVVQGAAIQGAILNEELSSESDILITDVCPYTLGIETLGFIAGMPVEDVYDVIIPRNTTIPVVKEKIYSTCCDNQEKVEIKVYQGDRKRASFNNFLGNFMLAEVPRALAGEEKVKVRFSYDVNGILQVEAIILSNENKASITIETTGITIKEEIDSNKLKESPRYRKYRSILRRGQILLEGLNDEDEYEELNNSIKELKIALIEDAREEELDEIEEMLTDLIFDLEDANDI